MADTNEDRTMTWTKPVVGIGWIVALVVLIADCILKLMGGIGLVEFLAIAAICAVRL